MGSGVGQAGALAYFGKMDVPAHHSLGWCVIIIIIITTIIIIVIVIVIIIIIIIIIIIFSEGIQLAEGGFQWSPPKYKSPKNEEGCK